ncbi:MAG TPA: hypothetical protein VHN14_36645 [Kofleriaceae bacterium]|nr:hypothetical protein [Kofleriaceae bacterium]
MGARPATVAQELGRFAGGGGAGDQLGPELAAAALAARIAL